MPPEATQVSPLIPFSPMPGGALTANTQMMRDNKILDKFPAVIKAMREVVEKGGFGTSVTPVSQFYFQQAFNNVMFGPWKKIAEGYGKMVLGYFGKTPVEPDKSVVKLASEQLSLKPTKEHAIDIADKDESKSLKFTRELLKKEGIEPGKSTLPGNVFKILVAVGDSVKKGQRMFVLEAMKMEIDVNAPKDGLVTSIEVQQGQTVANGQILAKI